LLKKLRRKFIAVVMGIVLAMLGIIFGLIFHFTKTDLENQSYADLQQVANAARQMGGLREPVRNAKSPYFVVYVTPFGEILTVGATNYDLNDMAFIQRLMEAVAEQNKSAGVLNDEELMYHYEHGRNGSMIVFVDTSIANDTLESLVSTCLIVGCVSILVFFGLSILLARWMVRPVERAWAQQKQFVSDASHELKTPLAVIMSNAELLRSPEQTDEQKAQFSDNIFVMSHQMRGLVEGLLELARADNGQVAKNFEKLDLSSLVSEAILPFEPVYFEKGLELKYRINPDIVVKGNDAYLRQVVDILLDNAAKYTAKGIVELNLQRRGRQCLLTVANPGKPIPADELEKVFERFYRSDEARTRTGSFGLGLPIAKSIVKEHRGKIWAISNPTGNCFCVLLPCES